MLKTRACYRVIHIFFSLAFAACLAACGGGIGASDEEALSESFAASPDTSADTMSTAAVYHSPKGRSSVGTLTVNWVAPTLSADGSPLTDLAGFRILFGSASGTYTKSVTVTDPTAVSYRIADLPSGTYYVAVQAYDTANNESLPSAELSKVIR